MNLLKLNYNTNREKRELPALQGRRVKSHFTLGNCGNYNA